MAKPVTAADRELLLREAEWTRSDIQDAKRNLERLLTAFFVVGYAVAGWTVNKVLSLPAVTTADSNAAFWALRTRADLLGALTVVLVLSTVINFMMYEAGVRWIRFVVHLVDLADKLGAQATNWSWILTIESTPTLTTWRNISMAITAIVTYGLGIWALWFLYPSTYVWLLAWWCWWICIGTLAVSVIGGMAFVVLLKPQMMREINDLINKKADASTS